jgi:hypothetical protein
MITISFLGDISLNDDYNPLYNKGVNPFTEIEKHLVKSDFVVGNLECLAKGPAENELKKPRLKTNIDTLNLLKSLHLKLVSLAHNHIYDNLEEGLTNTIQFLNSENIEYIGASSNRSDNNYKRIIEIKGKRFCFLNYVTDDTNPNVPENSNVYLSKYNKEKIIADIKSVRPNCDYLILLLHWGGRVEGGAYPDFHQLTDGNEFIDANVDLIIGHHSHVFQPHSKYKDKYIFYSLGNFCFSDIHFENKKYDFSQPDFRRAAIINVTFGESAPKAEIVPIINTNLHITLSDKANRIFQYRQFLFSAFLQFYVIWSMYFFYFKNIRPYIRAAKNKILKFI